MRHAKSSWDHPGLPDYDRPLNRRGEKAARRMAPIVAEWLPDWIACSSAQRTRSTLVALIDHLRTPTHIALTGALYESTEPAYLRLIRNLPNDIECALVIGHNPVLQGLCDRLAGIERPDLDPADHFPTGALVALRVPVRRWSDVSPGIAHVSAFVRPRDLPWSGIEAG